jgi:hypothetical protein
MKIIQIGRLDHNIKIKVPETVEEALDATGYEIDDKREEVICVDGKGIDGKHKCRLTDEIIDKNGYFIVSKVHVCGPTDKWLKEHNMEDKK